MVKSKKKKLLLLQNNYTVEMEMTENKNNDS